MLANSCPPAIRPSRLCRMSSPSTKPMRTSAIPALRTTAASASAQAAPLTPAALAMIRMPFSLQVPRIRSTTLRKSTRVAGAGVARALLLHDAHRHLGQIVEGQVVQWSLLDELHRPEQRVPPESLTVPDEHRRHAAARHYQSPHIAVTMPRLPWLRQPISPMRCAPGRSPSRNAPASRRVGPARRAKTHPRCRAPTRGCDGRFRDRVRRPTA